jgi:hypothetical protein
LACAEDGVVISVAPEEVDLTVVLLLPLVVFWAGTLDANILLLCLPYTTLKCEVKEENEIHAPWCRLRSGGGIIIREPKVEVKEDDDKVAVLLTRV